MEDKYDHEMMLKNIYIQMLVYKIHDEYNNLINVHHHYMLINKIKFHFELLKKKIKENCLIKCKKRKINLDLVYLVNVALLKDY